MKKNTILSLLLWALPKFDHQNPDCMRRSGKLIGIIMDVGKRN